MSAHTDAAHREPISLRPAGAVAAVVEEDHDEVDARVIAQLVQCLPEPRGLTAGGEAVNEAGSTEVGETVQCCARGTPATT